MTEELSWNLTWYCIFIYIWTSVSQNFHVFYKHEIIHYLFQLQQSSIRQSNRIDNCVYVFRNVIIINFLVDMIVHCVNAG